MKKIIPAQGRSAFGGKKVYAFGLAFLITLAAVPNFVQGAPHAAGTNVKGPDGTVYMITPEGTKRPYNSAGAFLSYGFNSWSAVVNATAEDLALPLGAQIPPQDGKIVCDTKQNVGTCYLITTGAKVAFPSSQIFTQQGFSFSNALYGDVSFLYHKSMIQSGLEAHHPGVLINKDGTIYLVSENGLLGIPSMAEFDSWGFKIKDVVLANNNDRLLPQVGVLSFRGVGQLSPIFVSTILPPVNNTIYPTAALSPYHPKSTIYTGSQTLLLDVDIKAPTNAPITISQMSFEFGGTILPSHISNVKIYHWENNNQVVGSNSGNVMTYNSGGFAINPPVTISPGGNAEFLIEADVNSLANGSTIQPKLTEVWTTTPQGYPALATVTGLPVISPALNILTYTYTPPPPATTYPTTTAIVSKYNPTTSIYTGSSALLFDFDIHAPSSGSLTIQQLSFEFGGTISPYHLSDLKVFHWETQKTVGSNSGNTLTSNSISFSINPPITISNGQMAEFLVRANVSDLAENSTILPKLTEVWISTPFGNAKAVVSGVPLLGPQLPVKKDTYSYTPYVPKMTVTSPIDGETIQIGTYKSITWNAVTTPTSSPSGFKITLYKKDGSGSYSIDQVITASAPNLGYYSWYVPTTLASGEYYVLVQDPTLGWSDDSAGDFIINNPNIPAQASSTTRDNQRLNDIRQLATALELYFNDKNFYPVSLSSLVPTYISVIPTAPMPVDGYCSSSQNSYVYTSPTAYTYSITFCLGSATQGYSAGSHTLSQAGIQ